MARPGAGLLASGSSAAPSRGAVATPVAAICSAANAAELARDGCRPVTVAGPRRSFTGLPLTTWPYVEPDSTRWIRGATRRATQYGKEEGRPFWPPLFL